MLKSNQIHLWCASCFPSAGLTDETTQIQFNKRIRLKTAYNTSGNNPSSCLTRQVICFNSEMSIFFESFQHQMCALSFFLYLLPHKVFSYTKNAQRFFCKLPTWPTHFSFQSSRHKLPCSCNFRRCTC